MQPIDLKSFFEFIYDLSGYDFRSYSSATLQRRVEAFQVKNKFVEIEQMKVALQEQKNLMLEFIESMTIQVTEMFRDPEFYRFLRENVFDILRTYPRIKIWHAGCSNGAEVYSMAILLHEAGLLERARLYATDINQEALKQAHNGVYDIRNMQQFTKNYQLAGGQADFADYYHADSHSAIMERELKKHLLFSFHNLATDWVFTEAHMIICRNVLIYFDKPLQDRVFDLFENSLVRKGLLGLGSKESLRFSNVADKFHPLSTEQRVFQLKG